MNGSPAENDMDRVNDEARSYFRRICRVVADRGRGLAPADIADAVAVAEEVASGTPDSARARYCRARLGIDGEGRAVRSGETQLDLGLGPERVVATRTGRPVKRARRKRKTARGRALTRTR